ncbi:MAG: hypothetical protein HWN80_12100 [Candidatus Lokiarchaeota archaeon]|nr:hypothetical protein [Candidatus Lokiarchaeota archaeon]
MAEYGFLIVEIVYFALGIMTILKTLKDWKVNKNRMLIAISVYITAILVRSLIDIGVFAFGFDVDINIVGGLDVGMTMGFILFTIQLEFMFYLMDLPKLYTLPVIITFYLMIGRILVDVSMPFIIYAMITGYGSAFFLIRDGRKSRNGLAIGMGLFFLFWDLGSTFQIEILFVFLRLLAMIALFLGTKGFYEKYVFVNVEEEQKIMGTWIAKLVVKE